MSSTCLLNKRPAHRHEHCLVIQTCPIPRILIQINWTQSKRYSWKFQEKPHLLSRQCLHVPFSCMEVNDLQANSYMYHLKRNVVKVTAFGPRDLRREGCKIEEKNLKRELNWRKRRKTFWWLWFPGCMCWHGCVPGDSLSGSWAESSGTLQLHFAFSLLPVPAFPSMGTMWDKIIIRIQWGKDLGENLGFSN